MNGHERLDLKDQVVIIGDDTFSQSIIPALLEAGIRTSVIAQGRNPESIPAGDSLPVLTCGYRNFPVLRENNLEQARAVLVNLPEDTDKLVYIIDMAAEFPGLKIIAPINNPDLKETFSTAGVVYPLSKDEIVAKMLGSYLFEPDVAEYAADLLGIVRTGENHDLQQYRITTDCPLNGTECGEAFRRLKEEFNSVLTGLSKEEEGRRVLYKNPESGIRIRTGDYLILLMDRAQQGILSDFFGTGPGKV